MNSEGNCVEIILGTLAPLKRTADSDQTDNAIKFGLLKGLLNVEWALPAQVRILPSTPNNMDTSSELDVGPTLGTVNDQVKP